MCRTQTRPGLTAMPTASVANRSRPPHRTDHQLIGSISGEHAGIGKGPQCLSTGDTEWQAGRCIGAPLAPAGGLSTRRCGAMLDLAIRLNSTTAPDVAQEEART